jgi:uncharacterized protein (DUF1778 family)
MKRRKPKVERKELHVRVLLTEAQKRELSEAAKQTGQGLATWMRATALREAARLRDR